MRSTTGLLWVLLASFGCGGGGGGTGGAAGTGNSTGTGAALTCASAPLTETIKEGVDAMNLTASGGKLYFIDAPGAVVGKSIDVMGEDGSAFSTLYQAPADNAIGGLAVLSEGIYFLQIDLTVTIPAPALMRIPVAGGAATQVLASDVKKGDLQLVASKEGSVFLTWSEVQGSTQPAFIGRFDISSSTLTNMAQLAGGPAKQVHLVGDTLYYVGDDASKSSALLQVAASASMSPETPVGQIAHPSCEPGLGVAITSTAIAVQCGIEMKKFDTMGMNPQTLIAQALHTMIKTDDAYFYATLPVGNTLGLARIPVAGGAASLVTCTDLPMSFAAVQDSPRKDQESQELVIADGYLFWATQPGAVPSKIVRIHPG